MEARREPFYHNRPFWKQVEQKEHLKEIIVVLLLSFSAILLYTVSTTYSFADQRFTAVIKTCHIIEG